MKRFTRETLEIDEADDKVQLTTFMVGLKSREFVVSLAKNPFKTIIEMLLKAQKYMNVEDALAAVRDVEKSREKGRRRTIIENKKGSVWIVESMTRVKGKTKELLEQ